MRLWLKKVTTNTSSQLSKSLVSRRYVGPVEPPRPVEFRGDLWHQKTRVSGLSCGVVCVILRLAVLVEHRLVTDKQTQTQTRTPAHGLYRACIASRGKNGQTNWPRQTQKCFSHLNSLESWASRLRGQSTVKRVCSQSPSCKSSWVASSGRLSDHGMRWREGASVRPSVAILQQFSSTRVFQFNKCSRWKCHSPSTSLYRLQSLSVTTTTDM